MTTDSEAYQSLGCIEDYFEHTAVTSERIAKYFQIVETQAKLAPPSDLSSEASVSLSSAIDCVRNYINFAAQYRDEFLAHASRVSLWGKRRIRDASNLNIELTQLKSQINQTQSTNKTKENEDWKRLVYIEADDEGHAFVYVTTGLGGEDFAAGEAFRNNAMQIEFVPQPNVALTIQYIDAISTLLKNKAHELPVRDV